jgi:hypothetical protein
MCVLTVSVISRLPDIFALVFELGYFMGKNYNMSSQDTIVISPRTL